LQKRLQQTAEAFMEFDVRLHRQVQQHPYPLLFATISGAHLYGFPSPDSDFDLRGVHVLPLKEVIGLGATRETVERSVVDEGMEIDLVTHDVLKFFRLLLRRNGYVLEQVLSPLVVRTSEAHQRLLPLAEQCVTRNHAHHYLGFASNQWKLFEKLEAPRVKPLLYVFRVLLTGIHLMRSGRVEANLCRLNETARLTYVDELIQQKTTGPEKGTLRLADLEFYRSEFQRLLAMLEQAYDQSTLPEEPRGQAELNQLLIDVRLPVA
jgi:uncharacterized protein